MGVAPIYANLIPPRALTQTPRTYIHMDVYMENMYVVLIQHHPIVLGSHVYAGINKVLMY